MPRLTPAVVRSLDILELFTTQRSLTAADVARSTGLPRASVHELMHTLAARQYLDRDDDGSFRLGVACFTLGQAYAAGLDLRKAGLRVAREVAAECDETVNVGILDGSDVIYLVIVDSSQPVRLVSRPGGRLPATCTAIGKALLSAYPRAQLEGILLDPLPRLTPRSVVDREELLDQLAAAHDSGLAFESGESSPDVTCTAAPVTDHTGRIVAALSVSVPDVRWQRRPRTAWEELVRRGAAALSERLGSPPAASM